MNNFINILGNKVIIFIDYWINEPRYDTKICKTCPPAIYSYPAHNEYLNRNWDHVLVDMNQIWLSRQQLELYANIVHAKVALLPNSWGLIDCTVRPVTYPVVNQWILHNRHKRVHSIKFQSVVPNGLIANLHGPVEEKCYDSVMLAEWVLLQQI